MTGSETGKHGEYALLTPGPLTTTATVKQAMLRDLSTWDSDYNDRVRHLRSKLVELAAGKSSRSRYTSVLMQGSGTFAVESVVGSAVPENGKLLIVENGAYGRRMADIARVLRISHEVLSCGEDEIPDAEAVSRTLETCPDVTHAAIIHCETTTGILNDIASVGSVVKAHGKTLIVDAMSSFGGIPINAGELGVDFLISSSNKCVQGVPGFGFVIAERSALENCEGNARSLSLDLYDQWRVLENEWKWRFTSPTHAVLAFIQALAELDEEGGIPARFARYKALQARVASGMEELGFKTFLKRELQSPIITSFHYPKVGNFVFSDLYEHVKSDGYVLYPGKISNADTFRIGNIGDIDMSVIEGLLASVRAFVRGLSD
ncbi:MAG: 2-aminoethylphosphonate--pyruvate transaminase [Synergistaceae bacterium]|jgi:2-aminoethylphosphonate-pyruvate transaminase|nr:2-aminoethylphosphonate--pyruvate transaminase [Synergistaceae bacterium]